MSDAKQIGTGQIQRVGDAGGAIVHAYVGRDACGVWLRSSDSEFVWLDANTGAAERVAFAGFAGGQQASLYPDRKHLLHRSKDALELWNRSNGLVAVAAIPSPPPSPYAMDRGRPEWDGWWFTSENAHLWYCGYDGEGAALLYLFDGHTLELLDTRVPRSSLQCDVRGDPEPIGRWGDFAAEAFRRFPDVEPIGLFGNVGDSFAFFAMYEGRAGKIVERATPGLERRVREASDERVFFVEFLSDDTLVTCDDLGLLGIIDVASARFLRRVIQPLDALSDGKALRVSLFDATPSPSLFQLRDLALGATELFLEYEVNEYAMEDELSTLGDFPKRFFLMLDRATLEPVALAPESEFGPSDGVAGFAGGLVAAKRGDRTVLYRWFRPGATQRRAR